MKNKDLIKDKNCDLDFLIGKTICDIGFFRGVEGGLAIDYKENNKENRVILGFTELGMWIQHNGPKSCQKTSAIMASIRQNFDLFKHEENSVSLTDKNLIIKGNGCKCICTCLPEKDCCEKYTNSGHCDCQWVPQICNCKCTCGNKDLEFKYDKKYIPKHIIELVERSPNSLDYMGFYFELSLWADTEL